MSQNDRLEQRTGRPETPARDLPAVDSVDRHFDALIASRNGDLVPIVERFVQASFAALSNGGELVGDVRDTGTGGGTEFGRGVRC